MEESKSNTSLEETVITIDEDKIDLENTKESQYNRENLSVKFEQEILEQSETDGGSGSAYKQTYAARKNVAEGMMDIALLTANANQLRFLITYNSQSQTYYISLILVIISLILQVTVGIGLIFRRRIERHKKNNNNKMSRTNDFLVGGVFMITVVNVFIASFTTTDA